MKEPLKFAVLSRVYRPTNPDDPDASIVPLDFFEGSADSGPEAESIATAAARRRQNQPENNQPNCDPPCVEVYIRTRDVGKPLSPSEIEAFARELHATHETFYQSPMPFDALSEVAKGLWLAVAKKAAERPAYSNV